MNDAVFCFGKTKFDSYDLAARVAKRMQHKATGKQPMMIYRCDTCGTWHIGGGSRKRPLRKRNSLGTYLGKTLRNGRQNPRDD